MRIKEIILMIIIIIWIIYDSIISSNFGRSALVIETMNYFRKSVQRVHWKPLIIFVKSSTLDNWQSFEHTFEKWDRSKDSFRKNLFASFKWTLQQNFASVPSFQTKMFLKSLLCVVIFASTAYSGQQF